MSVIVSPRLRAALRHLAAIPLLMTGVAAPAAVIESISVNTRYGYGFLGAPFVAQGVPSLSVRDGSNVGGIIPSEFGLDFTTTSSADSFFFLHNQYCVGRCTIYTMTEVTIMLRNESDTEPMRFDSQITAGHIARFGTHEFASASFDFEVTQKVGDGAARQLYWAEGEASYQQTNITTSDGVAFNGLTRSSNGDAWEVLDWSATNLNLILDAIPLGGTSTLVYRSTTFTESQFTAGLPTCTDLSNCYGVQVAFGDPRNDGGVQALRSGDFGPLNADPSLAPVIGRLYDASGITVAVVDADSDLPPQPMAQPGVTYGAPFASQVNAVPEPATWMTMIAGFGMVGWSCRRPAAKACAA